MDDQFTTADVTERMPYVRPQLMMIAPSLAEGGKGNIGVAESVNATGATGYPSYNVS